MSQPIIRMEMHGNIAVITHSNDAKMNALSLEFQQGTRDFFAAIHKDPAVAAVVFTAEGRGFCAGADLSQRTGSHGSHEGMGARAAGMMESLSNPLILDFQQLPVPVVCAINGAAAGAGFGLALAGDITLAAESAYFYLPFLPRLGIVPDLGSTWFLQTRLGRARSLALSLLGEKLSAQKAADWGLIHASVPDAELQDAALQMAARLAQLPPGAILEGRRALHAAAHNTLAEQLQYEADRQRELVGSPAFLEGARAFMEKRPAAFPARAAS